MCLCGRAGDTHRERENLDGSGQPYALDLK
jgi:hypothetical protein